METGPTRLRERRTVATYGESSAAPSTSTAAQDRATQEKNANLGLLSLSLYKEDHPIWQDPAFAPHGYPRLETWNAIQQAATWERLGSAGAAPPPDPPEVTEAPLTPPLSTSNSRANLEAEKVWKQDNPKWKWAPEEDEYIRQRWLADGAEAISIELGRSKGAVTARWSNVVKPRILEQEESLRQQAEGQEGEAAATAA
uniref:Myb-like domain-containing protein n=1 Tax=Pyramimonas obovata TaxID=1411642 RepID=A0A7S0RWB2_9CHLO|mmetsp:Transcript_811/g.1702  ORF Transcript_811/g.1702 Transcript_811/m.1702 type:complete len:199 (+) Transcript_811:63-659(+)